MPEHSKPLLASTPKIFSFFKHVDAEQHAANRELEQARQKVLYVENKRKEIEARNALKEKIAGDIKRRL